MEIITITPDNEILVRLDSGTQAVILLDIFPQSDEPHLICTQAKNINPQHIINQLNGLLQDYKHSHTKAVQNCIDGYRYSAPLPNDTPKPKIVEYFINKKPNANGQHNIYNPQGDLVCTTPNSPTGQSFMTQARQNINTATGTPINKITLSTEDMITYDDGKTFMAHIERPTN